MFVQFFIDHQSKIFSYAIAFGFIFPVYLLSKPKTLKLGLGLLILTFCFALSKCYQIIKNQPPYINSYKKICGVYKNNDYVPATRGKGSYNFNFQLDGYGSYIHHINHTKVSRYGYDSSKQLNLNLLTDNQAVCLHVSFNIYEPNRINNLLDIEYLTSDYAFVFKKICGQQVATYYEFGMEETKDNPYDLIFDLDHYGKFSLYLPPQHFTRSIVIGDVEYTNSHQKVCLIAKIPKVNLSKPDYLNGSDILMVEVADKPPLQDHQKQ